MSSRSAARGSAAASSIRLTSRTSKAVATSRASPSRCFLFCRGSRAARSAPIAAATVAIPPIRKPPQARRIPFNHRKVQRTRKSDGWQALDPNNTFMLSAPWLLCLVHARLITQPGGSRVRALCMTWPGSGTRSARSSRPMVVLALDLQPRPAATRTVGRIPSLRHDPFQPKDTRALQDQRAVAVQRLAQSQARTRVSEQIGQAVPSLLKRRWAQVRLSQGEKVERKQASVLRRRRPQPVEVVARVLTFENGL